MIIINHSGKDSNMIQRNFGLPSNSKSLGSRYCQSLPAWSPLGWEISTSIALEKMGLRKQQYYYSYIRVLWHILTGKRVSLGVCKGLEGLEGYTILASNDLTRNWTFWLFTLAEGWVEIKRSVNVPLERVWSRGWAAPREKTWEGHGMGCMPGWIRVAP